MGAASRHVQALLALMLAAGLLSPGARAQPAPSVSLRPLPSPDLARTEPALAAQIASLEDLIRRQQAQGAPASRQAEAWGTLAHLYYYYGFLEAAADAYANARLLTPEEPRWPYHQGVVEADRGRPERSAEHFAATLERAPDHPQALVRLGWAELDLDRPAAAVDRFARAVELVPDLAAAWEGLGRARLRLGKLDAAILAFQRALELQPRATAVHFPLAQALRRRGAPGDLEAAREHLESWGDVKVTLADPYMDRLGQATALSSYGLIRALAPQRDRFGDLKYFRFALGTLEGLRGAAERLSRDLQTWPAERIQADAVARARLYYVLGGLAGQAGRPQEAVELYGRALELLPDLHHARVERALELLRLDRRDEVRRELVRVFDDTLPEDQQRDPSFVEARLVLAKLLMAAGAPGRARDHFDSVAVHRPDSAEPWLGAAAARVLLGRRDEAVRMLESALTTVSDPAGRKRLEDLLDRLRGAPGDAPPETLLEGVP